MNFEEEDLFLKNKELNQLKKIHNKISNNLFREKDKSDRQTIDQVLDPRIMRIIEKYKNSQIITEFSGCISTGKEANVYYARGSGTSDNEDKNRELAIKIYKTSILIFKDRERYITGEFRFRHGYCKSNPRKMVALWAEKEIRNLKRLKREGINCPQPYNFKSNLIIMEFIGKEGVAANRLKDAIGSFENVEEIDKAYFQVIEIMKLMYKKCKLVHSDFSEYNLLYYEKKIYVIDVAQAVELQHVNANYFLKRDCHNINEFFEKNNINTLTDKQIYDFVIGNEYKIEDLENYIFESRNENEDKILVDKKFKENQNSLFCQFEVPFNLMEQGIDLISIDMDLDIAMDNLVKREKEKEEKIKNGIKVSSDEDSEEEEYEENEEEEEDEKDEEKVKEKKHIKFDPFEGMSKQERKKQVKENNKKRRENKKFTKKEKKKLIKKSMNKNKK